MASSILEELPSASQYHFCITQKGEGEITHVFPVNHVSSMINMPAVKFCGKGQNKVNTEPCKYCPGRLSSLFRSRKKSPRRRPTHSLPLPFSLWGGIHSAKQAKRSLPPPPLAPTLSSDEEDPWPRRRGKREGDLATRICSPAVIYIRGKELRISQYIFYSVWANSWYVLLFIRSGAFTRALFSESKFLWGVKVYRRFFLSVLASSNNWSPRLDVRYSLAKKTYVYPVENGCAYFNGFCNVSWFLRKTRGVSLPSSSEDIYL